MAEKKQRMTTPVGEARWAHINAPKAPFKDEHGNEKGFPKYMIDVVFSPSDPAWNAWAKELSAKIKALPEIKDKKTDTVTPKQNPLKKEFDSQDQPTGKYYCTFKTSDKFKPAVFDSWGKPMENVNIGNGSKVRVSYVESPYTPFGGGIAMYLNAVQVISLVEFQKQSASAYGFEETAPPPAEEDSPF